MAARLPRSAAAAATAAVAARAAVGVPATATSAAGSRSLRGTPVEVRAASPAAAAATAAATAAAGAPRAGLAACPTAAAAAAAVTSAAASTTAPATVACASPRRSASRRCRGGGAPVGGSSDGARRLHAPPAAAVAAAAAPELPPLWRIAAGNVAAAAPAATTGATTAAATPSRWGWPRAPSAATGSGGAAGGDGSGRASPATTATSPLPLPAGLGDVAASLPAHDASVDPFALVADDVEALSVALRSAVSVVQLPVLDAAAGHFFAAGGKRFRPAIVLLMSRAVAVGRAAAGAPSAAAAAASTDATSADALLLPSQRRLAEITEMIHTASLLHDDVIDASDTRRGVASVNAAYGNQVAVLAGDFLLARSSILLARLRNCDVVEELSTVIEHLVRGEVLQLTLNRGDALGGGRQPGRAVAAPRPSAASEGGFLPPLPSFVASAAASVTASVASKVARVGLDAVQTAAAVAGAAVSGGGGMAPPPPLPGAAGIAAASSPPPQPPNVTASTAAAALADASTPHDAYVEAHFARYLQKSFYKTASLLAHACRAAVLLGGHPPAVADAAYAYGTHVGIAFQLVDDALDVSAGGAGGGSLSSSSPSSSPSLSPSLSPSSSPSLSTLSTASSSTRSVSSLGKPAAADLAAGVVTAPALFALAEAPALRAAVGRRFGGPGDVPAVVAAIAAARGVEKTRELARLYAAEGVRVLRGVPPSVWRSALVNVAERVVTRSA